MKPDTELPVPSWRQTGPLTEEQHLERAEQTRIAKLCDKRYAIRFTIYMTVLTVVVVLLIMFFRS